jgi:hypothetical protein
VPIKQDRARLYLVVTFATMPENTYIMTIFWQHRACITLHAERVWTRGQSNIGSQFDRIQITCLKLQQEINALIDIVKMVSS